MDEGSDTLDFSAHHDLECHDRSRERRNSGSERQSQVVLSANDVMENMVGGALGDTITGNSLDNRLAGGAGNDTYIFAADATLELTR